MPLINPIEYQIRAQTKGCAVPQFNFSNLETLQGIAAAAREAGVPVIIATSPGAVKHMGLSYIAACARAAAEDAGVPVALHMDHCLEMDMLRACVAVGYTSLMMETGHMDYAANVKLMREVVALGHDHGCAVEGELGRIGGVEDDLVVEEADAAFTVPEQAAEYIRATGVDSLAVAIGTAHGAYKRAPKLDFERLRAIRALVDIPLVLHGASGVPDEDIRAALKLGVTKINIATELKPPFARALLTDLSNGIDDPRLYGAHARDAVREAACAKIRLFGTEKIIEN